MGAPALPADTAQPREGGRRGARRGDRDDPFGAVAGIFPEGKVNPIPTAACSVGAGVGRIALATGAPVVPVGIWGTQDRWPMAGLHYRRLQGAGRSRSCTENGSNRAVTRNRSKRPRCSRTS